MNLGYVWKQTALPLPAIFQIFFTLHRKLRRFFEQWIVFGLFPGMFVCQFQHPVEHGVIITKDLNPWFLNFFECSGTSYYGSAVNFTQTAFVAVNPQKIIKEGTTCGTGARQPSLFTSAPFPRP